MKIASLIFALLLMAGTVAAGEDHPRLIVVVGAAGTDEYGALFRTWAERWQAAAKQANAKCMMIGLEPSDKLSDREQLQAELENCVKQPAAAVWLVLIGHGTFDGKTARFNLRGPDISPAELNGWLKPIEQPLAVVNCASSSGPFLAELSAPRRMIITATKSGSEHNFARLGDYLATAITDPAADLDKDEQTSLLEAYLVAAARLREFYAADSRLATEHPLLDDNGDRLGTPAEWFQGLRPTKAAKAGASLDGTLASQFVLQRSLREESLTPEARDKRDQLERELAELRTRKSKLSEAEYLALLEPILVGLARLSQPAP